jgi:hypothetical protein
MDSLVGMPFVISSVHLVGSRAEQSLERANMARKVFYSFRYLPDNWRVF